MNEEIIFVFNIDGDQLHCTLSNYVNPMESPEGFGSTKKEALEDLLQNLGDELE